MDSFSFFAYPNLAGFHDVDSDPVAFLMLYKISLSFSSFLIVSFSFSVLKKIAKK